MSDNVWWVLLVSGFAFIVGSALGLIWGADMGASGLCGELGGVMQRGECLKAAKAGPR